MTAKEYLFQLRSLDNAINAKCTQLFNLKKDMLNISSPVLTERIMSSSKIDGTQRIIEKICDLQDSINDEIDRLVDLKAEAHEKIEALPNIAHRVVLTGYYLNNKKWEALAECNHYSMRHIFRLYGDALQSFREIHKMR